MNTPISLQFVQCDHQKNLSEWLSYLETLHPQEIELGLDRVREVYTRQNLAALAQKVIVVAGTNGKGSTIAMLEAMLLNAGYTVGSYTSPHLRYYNERVRVGGIDVDDGTLCRAFSRVECARGATSLSYFEFGTLAAFDIFSRHKLDVVLLEAGLGGRLDAVNIIDADIAVITTIDIDHQDWLGNDREQIGREKAGIMRKGIVTICGDRALPKSVSDLAQQVGSDLSVLGKDFDLQRDEDEWHWMTQGQIVYRSLPRPALAAECQYDNAAVAIAVLQHLPEFPVDSLEIEEAMENVACRGRFEQVDEDIACIFDVAHNPASARALAETLMRAPVRGQTRLVFGVMADKDIPAIMSALVKRVDHIYLAAPDVARAAEPGMVKAVCLTGGASAEVIDSFDSVAAAYRQAYADSSEHDRIVVCGSFYTVAEAQAVELI